MKTFIREKLFQIWYWYVSKVDKNAEVILMNYGFHNEKLQLTLKDNDEPNRYSLQLYYHLATQTDITNKDIIEIGSGRGGGLTFLTNTLKPANAIGIELNQKAVDFCNKHYQVDGLDFQQGDAQNLTLLDSCCDVVINVESSHRYPEFQQFLKETLRILRPGGYLLLTDFRYDYEMEEFNKDINQSGFELIKNQNINNEVVASLKLDDIRRRALIEKLTPRFLHKTALNFAGAIGSETYNYFENKTYIYFSLTLQKPV